MLLFCVALHTFDVKVAVAFLFACRLPHVKHRGKLCRPQPAVPNYSIPTNVSFHCWLVAICTTKTLKRLPYHRPSMRGYPGFLHKGSVMRSYVVFLGRTSYWLNSRVAGDLRRHAPVYYICYIIHGSVYYDWHQWINSWCWIWVHLGAYNYEITVCYFTSKQCFV